MIGLCPFHNEKTPSFTVSPSKNFYKCFGCGEAGDSIKFLMEHEHYSYPEALRFLAARYGIEIEEENWSPEVELQRQHRDSLHIINGFAQEYFQKQLFESDMGKSIGLSYFKERGYREEIIRRFGLGYSHRDGKSFTNAAVAANYNIDLLKELGLTTARDNDFFRARVIFPIHNLSGKPIAFAGRVLKKTERAPKYLNSPESEIYHKSRIVYGMHQASKSIRKKDQCILVEGYTDVLSLVQEGIEHVVASSGTALTTDQIRLIQRFSPNLVILYDGDAAGLKAATRGLDIALEQDMNVRVVVLPEGEDPDSLVRSLGGEKMQAFIEEKAEDVIFFKTRQLVESAGNDPVAKTKIARDVVSSIAIIPDPIKRSLYIKECARVMDLEEEMLIAEMNAAVRQQLKKKNRDSQAGAKPSASRPASDNRSDIPPVEQARPIPNVSKKTSNTDGFHEQKIAQLLIAFGGEEFEDGLTVAEYIIGEIEDVVAEFDHPVYKQLIEDVVNKLGKGGSVSEKYFLAHPNTSIRDLAYEFLQSPYELSPGWSENGIELGTQKPPNENFVNDSVESVLRLKLRKIDRLRGRNREKLKGCDPGDVEQQIHLLKVDQKLTEIHNHIAKTLRMVVPK